MVILYCNLSYKAIYPSPLMPFQFDQQDKLRNEDHKKSLNLINSFSMFSLMLSQFSITFSQI